MAAFVRPTHEQQRIQTIKDIVASAQTTSDLTQIIESLSLSAVKQFANQQIEEESTETISSIYYNDLPLDSLLPDDVQQNILGFVDLYSPKKVSKKWKSLSEKNERNYLNRLYSNIAPSTNQNATTYIIHQKRTYLHPIEIEKGYKGPINIKDAFKREFVGGDTLLFHDGIHMGTLDLRIESSMNLIGLGHNASIHFTAKPLDSSLIDIAAEKLSQITIQNINFVCNEKLSRQVITAYGDEKQITIKNCRFHKCDIAAESCVNWDVRNCVFVDADTTFSYYAEGSILSEICFTNCVFKNCGNICYSGNGLPSHCFTISSKQKSIKLECTWNIFEDCPTHPIVEYVLLWSSEISVEDYVFDVYKPIEDLDMYKLEDNMIKGNNELDGDTFDANKAYRIHKLVA